MQVALAYRSSCPIEHELDAYILYLIIQTANPFLTQQLYYETLNDWKFVEKVVLWAFLKIAQVRSRYFIRTDYYHENPL
jgi:hypothetical protein